MAPLRASVADYQRRRPDIEIRWDTRSLSDFGDGNLAELLDYDLIVFDHPYCGRIAGSHWFVDFEDLLSAEERAEHAADSLGPTWASYHAGGGIWGLPVDAAAQVASYRADLLGEIGAAVPTRLEDVIELGRQARSYGRYIALPAHPIDTMCTFLTLCANAGTPVPRHGASFPERGDIVEVLGLMAALLEIAHPDSPGWDPIRAYDHMSTHDDVVYIPYAFGYTNYSRQGLQNPITFCNIPGIRGDECGGALLGGAGIGVSVRSGDIDLAVDYARFLCSPAYQRGSYFRNGGQPASRAAWMSEANDAECMGFFSGTIDTLEQAYLRPTFDGYIDHFRRAGPRILACLQGQVSPAEVADWLRDDFFESSVGTEHGDTRESD